MLCDHHAVVPFVNSLYFSTSLSFLLFAVVVRWGVCRDHVVAIMLLCVCRDTQSNGAPSRGSDAYLLTVIITDPAGWRIQVGGYEWVDKVNHNFVRRYYCSDFCVH